MKTYFVFLCLIISGELAGATTQTTANQDKPPRLYVKSYMECVGSSTARSDDVFSGNFFFDSTAENFTYNLNANWSDGSGGAYSCKTHDAVDNSFGIVNFSVDWDINISSPPGIEVQVNTINDFDNAFGLCDGICTSTSVYYGQSVLPFPPYEQCDINVPIIDNSIFQIPYWGYDIVNIQTATRHTIQTTMKLQTGGKAISRLRNLFGLTASATQMYPLENNLYAAPWAAGNQLGPVYTEGGIVTGLFGTNISVQNITIGSYGALNANGVLYTSLPDNADVDVTPYVASVDDYTFNLGQPQKYHSYFDLFVQQANPGYSLIFYSQTNDVGHAFWQFRTDAPRDALQNISTNLTVFLGNPWGFYPSNGLFTVPGILNNDSYHSYNIKRSFYIGFPDLLQGLEFTRGISNAPPVYSLSGFNCVDAARGAGFAADLFGLPWDTSPQNFGVTLIEMYPAPGLVIGPFDDETDIFYSSAPY